MIPYFQNTNAGRQMVAIFPISLTEHSSFLSGLLGVMCFSTTGYGILLHSLPLGFCLFMSNFLSNCSKSVLVDGAPFVSFPDNCGVK